MRRERKRGSNWSDNAAVFFFSWNTKVTTVIFNPPFSRRNLVKH